MPTSSATPIEFDLTKEAGMLVMGAAMAGE